MVILWYILNDIVKFESLHKIDSKHYIGMIVKSKIQIHTLVRFTEMYIKMCLVIQKIKYEFFLVCSISNHANFLLSQTTLISVVKQRFEESCCDA